MDYRNKCPKNEPLGTRNLILFDADFLHLSQNLTHDSSILILIR